MFSILNIFKKSSSNNNNSNSNSNNTLITSQSSIDNSQLFFKIWRNNILKQHIIKYNRYLDELNIIKINNIKEYNNNIKNNYLIKSIVINSGFANKEGLLQFLKELPNNIESVEIKNSIFYIDVKNIHVPSTLKELKFDDQIHLVNYNDGGASSRKLNDHMNGIKSMHLGIHCDEIYLASYLPKSLKSLSLCCFFKKPITKSMLPEELKSLTIFTEYTHSSISLPKQLQQFSYGKRGMHNLNSAVLNCLPHSLESLELMAILDLSTVKPIRSDLVKSLKKLKMIYEFYIPTLSEAISKDTLSALTKLDLSATISTIQSSFDIDLLPQNLATLKLPYIKDIYGNRGFPPALTTYEGYRNHFRCKFQNPALLKDITIKILDFNQSNYINFNQFSNILSLRFCNIDSTNRVVLPDTSTLINLEIGCSAFTVYRPEIGDHDISQSNINKIPSFSNSNLKSIKLDGDCSYILFNSNGGKTNSIFPSTLCLLDITFSSLKINTENEIGVDCYSYPALSIDNLPSSIKYLIIRGTNIVEFKLPLPESLEQIYISNNNKIIISTLSSSTSNVSISRLITKFNELNDINKNKSKLYNKLKKFI